MYPFHDGAIPGFPSPSCPNGLLPNANANDSISSEAAAAMAAVMNLRQQQLNAVNQHQSDGDMPAFNLPSPQLRSGNLQQQQKQQFIAIFVLRCSLSVN